MNRLECLGTPEPSEGTATAEWARTGIPSGLALISRTPPPCPMGSQGRKCNSEEISLRLFSCSIIDKSELEPYNEISELHTQSETNFNTIGFTYPEDFVGADSLEQLKNHDIKLSQIKEALLVQQHKFKTTLQTIQKNRSDRCKDYKNSENLSNQLEKKFCSKCISKKKEVIANSASDSDSIQKSTKISGEKICPLCGMIYKKSVSFTLFHEHVIKHFTK